MKAIRPCVPGWLTSGSIFAICLDLNVGNWDDLYGSVIVQDEAKETPANCNQTTSSTNKHSVNQDEQKSCYDHLKQPTSDLPNTQSISEDQSCTTFSEVPKAAKLTNLRYNARPPIKEQTGDILSQQRISQDERSTTRSEVAKAFTFTNVEANPGCMYGVICEELASARGTSPEAAASSKEKSLVKNGAAGSSITDRISGFISSSCSVLCGRLSYTAN